MDMEVNVDLPVPSDWQRLVLNDPAPRKSLCCGRRAGKTLLVSKLKAVPHFLDGGRVLYGAPTDDQTMAFWESVNEVLHPLIKAGFLYRNKTKRYLEWLTGRDGRIKAKTAWDADSWRGDWGNLLIYDEWAYMHPESWYVVGAPMLLDTGGEAWFIFTPNRKNHAYATYTRGLDPLNHTWSAFNFSSYENPHLSKSALEEIMFDMSEDMILQEIMAQFLDNEGAVFRNIAACHNAPVANPDDHAGHSLMAGIDWGKKQDFTVISIGCMDCRQEVCLTRFNKIDYTYQRMRLKDDLLKWNAAYGLAETNAMGEPNLEALQIEGLPIEGFATTAVSKPPLIENLRLVLEREEMQFLDDPIARAEMEAYEVKITATTGRPTYSAPSGVHDDTVIARALMTRAITSYMPAFL